jgi:hypothetical protein
MKPAIYLTNPGEMQNARLKQPRVTAEKRQARLEVFRRQRAKCCADG